MIKISKQLGKYFVFISLLSVAFIAIVSNISINLFFSGYIRESRSKGDLSTVQYVEQLYNDNNGLNSQSLMSITHYAYSEAITIRLRDLSNNVMFDSGIDNMMGGMMDNTISENNLAFSSYPVNYKNSQVLTIDIGRTKSIISSVEDKQFIVSNNLVFVSAFIFSVILAVILSRYVSKKFLHPIYLIKENAGLIEKAKYNSLKEVETNTAELHDLSATVKELAEKLEYQEVLRKRMTSDIAHELRTPLATMKSHIEAFMDGVWELDTEKLSVIHDEIDRLTKLIKELSDLSTIESDAIKLNLDTVDISKLLEVATDNFEPLFISKNIQVIKNIQDNITMLGDRDRLYQVFINILSNAFKYTNETGKVAVELLSTRNAIRISVEDTGIGIPKEDLKHIFERFYRSDVSRNRGTGGTGIGLTVTKALVEAHNGTIDAESEPGKGTKFTIVFKK